MMNETDIRAINALKLNVENAMAALNQAIAPIPWRELADAGFRFEAMKAYRDQNNIGLERAVREVDQYINSKQ